MLLPITSLTALACGIILFALTIRVVFLRRRDGIVLGDNNDRVMTKAIRGHANAAEQMPMALIVMALAEMQGVGGPLALMGILLVAGRLMHGAYFAIQGVHWRFRFYGMLLTAFAQVGLLLSLAWVILT